MTAAQLTVRSVRPDDAPLLFDWANDAGTRAASFDTAPIPWDTHVAWLGRKLADPGCRMYVLELDGAGPIGVVRFDGVLTEQADVSVTVAPGSRGHGLSAPMLDASVNALFGASSVARVRAFIKPENVASVRAFERAGFRAEPSERSGAVCRIRSRETR